MAEEYLLVHKSILPDYFGKVIEARRMLRDGRARDVSDAAKKAGISRSTYYKYRDCVFEPTELSAGRKAVIACLLEHEPGMLSRLIACLSSRGGSILTIDQSLPIHDTASVTVCLDVSRLDCGIQELIRLLEEIPGVRSPKLVVLE